MKEVEILVHSQGQSILQNKLNFQIQMLQLFALIILKIQQTTVITQLKKVKISFLL